jgi:para-aminobenzoate synthetase / 4-amino-4-deoxychorismate lyase
MSSNIVIRHHGRWLRFDEPVAIITAEEVGEVMERLRQVETAVTRAGLWAAGFISYEAAPGFDPALRVRPAVGDLPLLYFSLHRPETVVALDTLAPGPATYSLGEWQPSLSAAAYQEAIAAIKEYIANGETYQVNYTFRLRAPFAGASWRLFVELAQAQPTAYAAYVDTGRFAVCSASPELFFHLDGTHITARPMKGTAARGLTLAGDEAQAEWLRNSAKNRAENVMIVDMIRNDLGRVARVGQVAVPALFTAERYPTLWQMTSTVTAVTDHPFSDIMAALFPCASITGAPKVRTMAIIAGLETAPRGVYTGAIGFLAPGRQAQFSVAIRSVVVDRQRGQAEYGVGSGIVWDSDPGEEYEECRIKARLLGERHPEFSLLETMLWQPESGYFLLEYHLQRLADSAVYFAVPVDLAAIRQELAQTAATLSPQPHRVRLLVAQNGVVTVETGVLPATAVSQPLRVGLAPEPVNTTDPFLYHKTTRRQLYESVRAARPDCDDVLLWNERGEVTEACLANVVVELDGRLLTPPVASGLLPGVFRRHLLEKGDIHEAAITLADLDRCRRLYLINSVRRWQEVVLIGEKRQVESGQQAINNH